VAVGDARRVLEYRVDRGARRSVSLCHVLEFSPRRAKTGTLPAVPGPHFGGDVHAIRVLAWILEGAHRRGFSEANCLPGHPVATGEHRHRGSRQRGWICRPLRLAGSECS